MVGVKWPTKSSIRGSTIGSPGDLGRLFGFQGSTYFTMGLVPLSKNTTLAKFTNPVWLDFSFKLLRTQGRGFFNFDGLNAFETKFHPAFR